MKRIRLIHWRPQEAETGIDRLKAAGYSVDGRIPEGSSFLKELRKEPPAALLIDLNRLPSQGRDLAMAIRCGKTTRTIPILFLGGSPEKVRRIQTMLPDAIYSDWDSILPQLPHVIANPPLNPVVPASALSGYSGTPLPRKLGIKPNSVTVLLNAPDSFSETLGDVPQGALFRNQLQGKVELVICFVRSRKDLQRRLSQLVNRKDLRRIWFAWPKMTSSVTADLSQEQVREAGLAAGLVDYKICSIDSTWSGLLFTRRKHAGRDSI